MNIPRCWGQLLLVGLVVLTSSCSDSPDGESAIAQRTEAGASAPAAEDVPEGMVWIPGGTFTMGTPQNLAEPVRSSAEEWPPHKVALEGFFMDATEVTNAQFAKFVEETGYKTFAERPLDPKDFPGATPEMLAPAAFVVKTPETRVDPWANRSESPEWWHMIPGANWREPEGPGSSIERKEDHPVVNVTIEDAMAYADWAGKRVPTEAEWEYAARGGHEQRKYIWGNELAPGGKWLANMWQGDFPNSNSAEDGFETTAPAKSFPPNDFGLYDMAGNVWELVQDRHAEGYYANSPRYCPTGAVIQGEQAHLQRNRLIRGGSFLCAEGYCSGYRPSARQLSDDITASYHTGFRCVQDP
ncbi:MAG: formylglycine-generating enzyme family protein [Verrucomicrobiota bacterium]